LCSSSSFVENIANRGISNDKLVFWPQFCIVPDFSKMIRPECYQDQNFNIVFTGNIGEAQGLDLLVDTALRLKDTNVRWFLVGDGRAREKLERRVIENNLSNIVIFVGKVTEEEANRYIHFADCAYLSFKKNKLFDMTLPAKLQSYMACGTPILAAAGGESARVIQNARCGFVCEQNAEQLADVIKNNVMHSNELGYMKINAKKYFEKHFAMDLVVSQLETLMKKGCSERNKT